MTWFQNPHKKSTMAVHPLGGVEENRLLKLIDCHPFYQNQWVLGSVRDTASKTKGGDGWKKDTWCQPQALSVHIRAFPIHTCIHNTYRQQQSQTHIFIHHFSLAMPTVVQQKEKGSPFSLRTHTCCLLVWKQDLCEALLWETKDSWEGEEEYPTWARAHHRNGQHTPSSKTPIFKL